MIKIKEMKKEKEKKLLRESETQTLGDRQAERKVALDNLLKKNKANKGRLNKSVDALPPSAPKT